MINGVQKKTLIINELRYAMPSKVEKYIIEFIRVLKPGGKAIIHRAGNGGFSGGWRSNVTQEMFTEMLVLHQLIMISQFDSWG